VGYRGETTAVGAGQVRPPPVFVKLPAGGVQLEVEVWVKDVELIGIDSDDGACCGEESQPCNPISPVDEGYRIVRASPGFST